MQEFARKLQKYLHTYWAETYFFNRFINDPFRNSLMQVRIKCSSNWRYPFKSKHKTSSGVNMECFKIEKVIVFESYQNISSFPNTNGLEQFSERFRGPFLLTFKMWWLFFNHSIWWPCFWTTSLHPDFHVERFFVKFPQKLISIPIPPHQWLSGSAL